jgi:hypothetical protein
MGCVDWDIGDANRWTYRSTNRVEYRPRWGLVSARAARSGAGDGFDGVEFLRADTHVDGALRRWLGLLARWARFS